MIVVSKNIPVNLTDNEDTSDDDGYRINVMDDQIIKSLLLTLFVKYFFLNLMGKRTLELELLLHMVDSDDEKVSPENEDSLTTNEIKLGIENTKHT